MTRCLPLLLLVAACAPDETPPDDTACDVVEPGATFVGPDGGRVRILATDPAPPARFTNWWTVDVDDATTMTVSAFMPEHDHGSPTTPTVTVTDEGVVVGPLELWMPGRWEVRFDLAVDQVVVPVCIAA